MKRIKLECLVLIFILIISLFLRLFRLSSLLGFWYDQGRDALVIWNLIHYGKFFLIGPVTGIEGIFLGPFYYYLISPFYWVGNGNPAVASAGICLLTVGAIYLTYFLGKNIFNTKVGLIAAFLFGFSYSNITFSRWLANPVPLLFFSTLLLYFLYDFINGNKNRLIWVGLILGLCLQLEAASAIFFIPATIIIVFLNRKGVKRKYLFLSLILFFITFLPQFIFNFRHDNILVNAFKKFLVEDRSFKTSFFQVLIKRVMLYYDIFCGYFFPNIKNLKIIVLALFSAPLFFFRKKLSKTQVMLWVWFVTPLVGLLFYQGNHGYIWDYYFTGVFPVFLILFANSLSFLFEKALVFKIMTFLFLGFFMVFNIYLMAKLFRTGVGITIGAEKKAIDWIYQDIGGEDFNVDVYVPPQIYFSYSYMFQWYGKGKYGREPNTKMVKNLYTIYEPDADHPYFLDAWLKRQDGIGKMVKDYSWGSVTVQKRDRVKYE